MRIMVIWLLASLGLCLTACVATTAAVAQPSCAVTHVVDGDTLHLTCNGVLHKVRLLGYDTPETFQSRCPAEQRAGQEATQQMRRLVASGQVTEVTFSGRDRYGRDLAFVQVAGRDLSAAMLATPLARPYQGRARPDWCRILGA